MAVSQNGWLANDRSVIETYTVGKGVRVALRKGDAGFLLKHVADWFDANIKDIDLNYNNGALDDWGYAERPIRGGVELSNHASGTAIDVNATNWPLGVEPTSYLTQDQINRLRTHLKIYEGAIRWGGDYTGRKDPMHFEINKDAAFVARIAAKLRAPSVPAGPPVIGAILAAWDRTGRKVGAPKGTEVPTLDKVGRWQEFTDGAIYWHPNVDKGIAHEVRGNIFKRWRAIGSELVTGYPVTDESVCPDNRGRFNHFAGGWSIYWTPQTGAWEVHGAFRDYYASTGWERGRLGYPMSAEYKRADGLLEQKFEKGRLVLLADGTFTDAK